MSDLPELTDRHVLYALVGGGLLLVMGVLVLASGIVAPTWAVLVLGTLWLLAAGASVVGWRRSMYLPLKWAVVVGLAWVAIVGLGGALLDWNA